MTITVCKDCQERHSACWDSCEKYQEERKKFEEEKQARIKAKSSARALDDIFYKNKIVSRNHRYRGSVEGQPERWSR